MSRWRRFVRWWRADTSWTDLSGHPKGNALHARIDAIRAMLDGAKVKREGSDVTIAGRAGGRDARVELDTVWGHFFVYVPVDCRKLDVDFQLEWMEYREGDKRDYLSHRVRLKSDDIKGAHARFAQIPEQQRARLVAHLAEYGADAWFQSSRIRLRQSRTDLGSRYALEQIREHLAIAAELAPIVEQLWRHSKSAR